MDEQHVRKLDWSQYHPLDHWPYSRRCRSFPGSGRRHLRDAWDFRRREETINFFWKLLRMCHRGRHQWKVWHHGDIDKLIAHCLPCGSRRPATEEETIKFNSYGPMPIFDHDTKHVGLDGAPEW